MSVLDSTETFSSLLERLGVDIRLRKAVQRLGHVHPTLVQAKCLPLAISSGRDLLVRANTGSGKTLGYCLPLLHKILKSKDDSNNNHPGVRAVILVPTRELCSQVQRNIQQLIYYCHETVSVATITGIRGHGSDAKEEMARQAASLRDKPDVLVASPAGLLAHIQKGNVDLKSTFETLVVDEADLVLSFGYSEDVSNILLSLPKIYQGFLMSATLSPELSSLKKVILHSPVVLKLERDEEKSSRGQLTQFFIELPKLDKNLVIYVFLKLGLLKGKGIFFVNTTDSAYRLKLFLEQFHIRSCVLNPELPFASRMNIIEQFNVGNFDYLVATDESSDAVESDDDEATEKHSNEKKGKRKDAEYGVSRGLDFQGVSFVVNVDFPPSPKSYAHRIGRTARGVAKGVALSLVNRDSEDQLELLREVQADQPKIPLSKTVKDNLQAVPDETDDTAQEQVQPSLLDFDLREIEGFRYRVEDVQRAVTKSSIKETRAAELRAEILNSERLQGHFEENPMDLQLLQHDRLATHVTRIQEHLKNVPKYLLPQGMQVADLRRKRKKRRNKKSSTNGLKRRDNDPLQNFDGEVDLEGLEDNMGEELPDFSPDDPPSKKAKSSVVDKKIFANTTDGVGQSTAGRNAWKEKHKKGKFSNKKRKSERKARQPLGI